MGWALGLTWGSGSGARVLREPFPGSRCDQPLEGAVQGSRETIQKRVTGSPGKESFKGYVTEIHGEQHCISFSIHGPAR